MNSDDRVKGRYANKDQYPRNIRRPLALKQGGFRHGWSADIVMIPYCLPWIKTTKFVGPLSSEHLGR